MKKVIWAAQILLAIAFISAGSMKLMTPYEELAVNMPWVLSFAGWQVVLIGILETAGALGLIIPAATGIKPRLTYFAAIGLQLDMIGAAITHLVRGEYGVIVVNLILFGLAWFVAYGRKKYFIKNYR